MPSNNPNNVKESPPTKEELIKLYKTTFTPENRIKFCEIAKNKNLVHKYSFKNSPDEVVDPNDYIVQDDEVKELLDKLIAQKSCSVDELKMVLNKLTLDQISYIGY